MFSCGTMKQRGLKNQPLRPHCRKAPGEVAFYYLFNNYKSNARRRGYAFTLTLDQFRRIVTSPCSYCGSPPLTLCKRDYDSVLYSGIDRVDNSFGYIEGNSVACCKRCNLMKGTMGVQEFFDAVAAIHAKKVSASDHERRGEPTLKHTEPLVQ
jgi:hypothetical protein